MTNLTDAQLLNLARDAYNENPDYSSDQHQGLVPEGFVEVDIDLNEVRINQETGQEERIYDPAFKARSYYNSQTNELIIAPAGTNDLSDLLINDPGYVAGYLIPQFNDAEYYYNAVLQQVEERGIAINKEDITVTGHSHGGGLASMLGVYKDVATVGFNDPGISRQLDNLEEYDDIYVNGELVSEGFFKEGDLTSRDLQSFDNVRHVVLGGDFVHLAGEHVGAVEEIDYQNTILGTAMNIIIGTVSGLAVAGSGGAAAGLFAGLFAKYFANGISEHLGDTMYEAISNQDAEVTSYGQFLNIVGDINQYIDDATSSFVDVINGGIDWISSAIFSDNSAVRDGSNSANSFFERIFGEGDGSAPLDANGNIDLTQIDNSLINLTINTDLDKDFRPVSNPTQTGNAIDGGDYFIESDIDVLNGDGVENTTPMGILSDQIQPGNMTIAPSEDFVNSITLDINRLEAIYQQYQQDYEPQFDPDTGSTITVPHIELQDPMAEISNQAIAANNFINIDPVILDLDGNDKIDLISYNDSQVIFDVDNDNKKERTGWVSGQDGILVHDKNQDGVINDITETVSEYYSLSNQQWWSLLQQQGVDSRINPFILNEQDNKYSKHGIAALQKLDTNQDGKINSQDAIFSELQVWQDENEDGITQDGELKSLNEAGIQEFDLTEVTEIDKTRNEGNVVLAAAAFTTIYGHSRLLQAVDFTTNPIGYEFNDVNLGSLAISEEGTSSLAITDNSGVVANAANENVRNIFGGVGDDEIIGDDQNNLLSGGAGSDILRGGDGDDILIIDSQDLPQNIDGGQGRDIVIVNSDDGVALNLADINAETVVGGNGDDLLIAGGVSNAFIDGGSGDDVIIGGAADDALSGSGGDDLIDGAFGDDVIRGHRGNDTLNGGQGGDLIDGGLDNDQLFGGAGKDILIGGAGDDEIDGGEGYDLAKYSGSYGDYQVYKENGDIIVRNLSNNDTDILKNIEAIRFDDITINIGENTAPMAVTDQILIASGQREIFVAKEDLLANDLDLERDQLDIRTVENAVGGTVELVRDDGVITGVKFTTDSNYSGVMSFDYSVVDENGAFSQVTLHNNDGTSQQADHKAKVQFKLSDDPSDPLYYDQWYLSEINIRDVWREYKGDGVTVGVFEDGDFNRNHQDLADNILPSHIIDQEFRQVETFAQHATTVAGVIAAQDNDFGIIGVAPNASLDGYGWNADADGLENLKNVDVANNSWGASVKFIDNFSDFNSPYAGYENLLEESVKEGRGGLGTINVFAGGNQRQEGDNVNYHNLQNSRFVITTGSINQEGDLGALVQASTPFSNPGSAILVSAPGSNIKSTGNLLENANGSTFLGEFSSSQGTSFSAPIVSGIVALMLESNPDLGYRDVQKILALSARKFDDPNTFWLENGADNFNGGAMHYSEDYGFGIVDARAAVRLAESWDEINNFYNEVYYAISNDVAGQINDNDKSSVNFEISNSNMHNIENVEVFVNISHDDISQLQLVLVSPSGTRSILMDKPEDGNYDGGIYFNFSSRHFLGENIDGQWTLEIIDDQEGAVGTINSWQLKFYGKLDDGTDDQYYYSNEIASLEGSSRLILRDNDGGIDTINAVMISSNSVINLNAGQISNLNGQEIAIASNQYNDEYYAKEEELQLKTEQLAQKQQQLEAAQQLVISQEEELAAIPGRIENLVAQYNEVNPRFSTALDEFNAAQEWFDNHEYLISTQTHHVFRNVTTGQNVEIRKSDYDRKVDDYNTKYDTAINLQNQINEIVDNYNALNGRQDELDVQIQQNRQAAEEFYQEVQDLTAQVAFAQEFLSSFNDSINTVIENAYSGDGNDILIGNEYDNELMAGRGENSLTGGAGSDIFVIKKGAVSDVITDFAIGRDQIDLTDFATNFSALNITQSNDDAVIRFESGQVVTLQNINSDQLSSTDFKFEDAYIGTDDADVLSGNNLSNEIDGLAGNDIIYGNGGDDILRGGDGDDIIYGGAGDDEIYDGAGKDVIYGGFGNDIIHIENDNSPNVTISGAFSQIDSGFFGGAGDDIFVIARNIASAGFLSNLIYDFEVANHNEKIDLTAFTAIDDISDLRLGNININGQQYLRVTLPDQDSNIFNDPSFVLKDITKEQLSNDNFIFSENEAATATGEEVVVARNNSVNIDILANDSDDKTIFTKDNIVIVKEPDHGTIVINEDGTLTYNPRQGFYGSDQVKYYLVDEGGLISNVANIAINVEFINENPILTVTESATFQNHFVAIDVLSAARDNDGDEIFLDSVSNGENGTAKIINNKIIYIPNEGFVGQDVVTYRVIDSNGGVSNQEISINITQPDEILGTKINDELFAGGNRYVPQDPGTIASTFTGDDEIYLNSGNALVDAGAGNDYILSSDSMATIIGGQGGDIFAIADYSYNDNSDIVIINDFEIDNDLEKIDLRISTDFTDFEQLNIEQNGNDAIINLSENSQVILQNVNKDQLSADNFIFHSNYHIGSNLDDDIHYYNWSQDVFDVVTVAGGGGNDILNYSLSGDDLHYVLDGGTGDDELNYRGGEVTLIGGAGDDKFAIYDFGIDYYTQSADNLVIEDFEIANFNEKIVINSKYISNFSDLIFVQQDNNTLIKLGSSDLEILVKNTVIADFSADNFQINHMQHDPFIGSSSDFEVIDSNIEGSDQGEVIISNYPYQDYVANIYGRGGNDIIRATGYEENIFAGLGDDDLDFFGSENYYPTYTQISEQAMQNVTNFYGEDGDDQFSYYYSGIKNHRLDGGAGDDYFVIGEGSPILIGGTGSDFYEIEPNFDSTITIKDFDINQGGDKIDLTKFANINNLQDLDLRQDGQNTVINLPENQVIILENIDKNNLVVDNFQLILSNKGQSGEIFGTSGYDVISGYEGDDIIDAGLGFDEVRGGVGVDSFIISHDPNVVDLISDFDIAQEVITLNNFTNIENFSDLNISYHKNEFARVPEYFALVDLGEGQFVKLKNVTQNNPLTADNFVFNNITAAPEIINNNIVNNNFLVADVVFNSILQNQNELPAIEVVDGQQVSPDPIANYATTINQDGEVFVTFKNSVAGYKNSIGWYQIGENGEMLNPQLLFKNAKNVATGTEFSLGEIAQGTNIGFFIIADGGRGTFMATNYSSFQEMRSMNLDNGNFTFVNNNGEIATIFDDQAPKLLFTKENGKKFTINKNVYHSYNNKDLNPDDKLHSGAGFDQEKGQVLIGFEDLYGGGDQDYNDVLFYLSNTGSQNSSQYNYVNSPALNIAIKSEQNITSANIEISNSHQNDKLIFDNNFYIINEETGEISKIIDLENNIIENLEIIVEFSADDKQVNISGQAMAEIYQDIISSIKFVHINADGVENINFTRIINVEITDQNQLSSNIETKIIIAEDPKFGHDGNDILNGDTGNDVLIAKLGDDILNGYDGDDTLVGGVGADILTGGFGFDSFNFNSLNDSTINKSDLITDFTQGQDSINFSNLNFTAIQAGEGAGTVLGYNYDSETDFTTISDINSSFVINLSGNIELTNDDCNFIS